MTPTTPSLVLFDLDGVLVDYDRAVRISHLANTLRRTADEVRRALFDSGLEARFDAGRVEADDYLRCLGDALQARVDREAWRAARGAAMRLDPATTALVSRVARQCDVALLTNNGGLLVDSLPILLPALVEALGGRLLCSARLGALKPEPAVFLSAVRAAGHAPATTLFLDDAVANVEGARRAGLRAEHVPGPRALAGALARHGLG